LIQSPKFCHLRVSYFLTKFPSSSSRLSRWERKKKIRHREPRNNRLESSFN
jgi:hypothetical protein